MRHSIRLARFRSILCPVDFSTQSGHAIRQAAKVARRSDGRLTVLFVYDPLLFAAAAAVYHRGRGRVVTSNVASPTEIPRIRSFGRRSA